MVVTKELVGDMLECIQAAVYYAEAEVVIKGQPLDEMKRILDKVQTRVGTRG